MGSLSWQSFLALCKMMLKIKFGLQMSLKLYSPLEINNRESWGRNPGKRCSCLPLLRKSTSHSSGPLWAGECPRAGNSYHGKNLDGQDCGQVLSLQGNSHHPLYALARDQILNPSGSSERPVMLPRAGQQCLPHTGAKANSRLWLGNC